MLPQEPDQKPPLNGPLSSRELVNRARADAASNFTALYTRMAPALFAWARLRILPELRKEVDPEDLVQEVCFRAYEKFATFQPDRAVFRAWLFGIANNVLRESLRRLRRRPDQKEVSPRVTSPEIEQVPDSVTSVSRRIARDEAIRSLIDDIEKFSEEDRRLLLLRGIEGLKHAQVAELLGLSLEAVEKRWQRVLKKFETIKAPEEFFAD